MDISVRITRDENAEYFGVEVGDVVQVPFEQYVAAVVASEIGNALIEACKAQAVASRTFAVHGIDFLQIKLLVLVLVKYLTGFLEHSEHVE